MVLQGGSPRAPSPPRAGCWGEGGLLAPGCRVSELLMRTRVAAGGGLKFGFLLLVLQVMKMEFGGSTTGLHCCSVVLFWELDWRGRSQHLWKLEELVGRCVMGLAECTGQLLV